jgi:hypothetical protein
MMKFQGKPLPTAGDKSSKTSFCSHFKKGQQLSAAFRAKALSTFYQLVWHQHKYKQFARSDSRK